MIKSRHLLLLCFAFFLSSCGTHKMALTKGQSTLDTTNKSIALLSLRVTNQHHPTYQLDLIGAVVCPEPETCARYPPYLHRPESIYNSEKDGFNEYLLSFELDSGTYNLTRLITCFEIPFLVGACADTSLDLKTEVHPNSVIYLGHIDTTLREIKNDSEERGCLFPLIDAAIVGYSTGTFDVVVEDRFDEDMKLFCSEYPALQSVTVKKSILPQWIRPENREKL